MQFSSERRVATVAGTLVHGDMHGGEARAHLHTHYNEDVTLSEADIQFHHDYLD